MPDSVLDIIHQLSRARSEDEIVAVASQAVRMLLGADGATFALRDGDHCYYASEDAVSPLWSGRRLPMSGCVAGWCMINGQTAAIADIHNDHRMFTAVYRPDFVRSLAVAPVGLDEPVAALSAYWSERRQPGFEDLERLQAIADGVALALANLQRHPARPSEPQAKTAPAGEATDSQVGDHASLRPAIEAFLHQGLRPNSRQAYGFAAGCVVVAALLQLGVRSTGVEGLTVFSFFYPATLIATLVGGRWAGALAAALGAVAADYFFMLPLYTLWPVTVSDLANHSLYAASCATIIVIIDWHQRTVARLKLEDARHLTLAREQQHRARNAVAVAESIVRHSLRSDSELARIINQRIRAAFADVEIRLRTRPIRMVSLLNQELEPFDLARFSFEGDREVVLEPEVSSILTLAAHELATNALKYGALSDPEGQVAVAWRSSGAAAIVRWEEAGGPLVERPQGRGFGSIMLRRLVEAAGGAILVDFRPTGVTAEISLPLAAMERPAAARWRSPFEAPAGEGAEMSPSETPAVTRG